MSLSTSFFQQLYRQLNPAQKKAVDTTEGPVMVMAGPGSGKTQVLTARIANILRKTDTDPTAILALTFTDSAAKNMRSRLVEMIGKTGYYVHINTFHSFCLQVIRDYPEYFPIDRDSQPLTDLERFDLFEDLISDHQLQKLKPLNAPYYYLRDIISAISDLKREGVSPDLFSQIVEQEQAEFAQIEPELTKTKRRRRQKNINKHQDLLTLYQAYQQQLRAKQRYDFDDMIALVVEAFKQHELLLRDYQEKLHYFLVDEYQDTNTAQNQVVNLLASYWQERGGQANVFAVGDPNQAIYRFQGASVENMLAFVEDYPQATIISLDTGYRCPQPIYDAAQRVIKHNQLNSKPDAESQDLQTQSQDDDPPSNQVNSQLNNSSSDKLLQLLNQRLTRAHEATETAGQSKIQDQEQESSQQSAIKIFKAPVQTLETIYVAEEISQLLAQGVEADDIAILYRYNSDEAEIAQALQKWGIRYEIDGGDDVLKSEVINQLLSFFQVLLDLRRAEEDETLFAVMQYQWFDLDRLAVMKLGRIAGKEKCSLLDLLDYGYSYLVEHDYDQLLTEDQFAQISQFRQKLYDWSQLDLNHTFTHWFELALKRSGFLSWMKQQPQRLDILHQINSLYNEVKALVSQDHQFKLADFMRTIEVMKEHRLKINVEDLNIRQDAVHLSTVHKAKGQEWDYVFIIHCVDKKWGNRYRRELVPLPEGILQNTDLSQKERNEDERRVFYVALTRAKKQVTITYPETVVQDNQTQEKFASQFLSELMSDSQSQNGKSKAKSTLESSTSGSKLKPASANIKQVTAQPLLDQAEEYLARLIEPEEKRQPSIDEKQFFGNLVSNFKLSVTALNTYLRDPQDFVENTLLRIPRAKPAVMAFGSAVHKALEQAFSQYQEQGSRPDEQYLLTQFKQALQQQVLTKQEFQRRLKHGQEVLRNYWHQTQDQEPEVMLVERFFGSGWQRAILDQNIYLTGRIDRIDWVDREAQTVRVIDYKTGRNKTKGFIEGRTKSANLSEREQSLPDSIKGPYKRQLLFYKLLADLDRTFQPTVVEGVFDFVEPYDKHSGRLKPRKFKLLDEDVEDLKDLIRQVMSEIRNLQFLQQV